MRHLQGVRTEVVLSECILFYFTPPREDLHEVPPRSHAPGLGRKVSCESSWRFCLGRNGNLSHILYSQLNFAHKGIAAQGGKRFRCSPHFTEGLWLIWAPVDLCISSGQGCSAEAWTLTAQGVKDKARAADSEILLQPSKVHSHVAEMA